MLDLGLLACYAHPDDEQGVSGTLVKALQFGHRVGILMTTRGEAGEIAPGVDATPDNLGEVREGEMRCAAAALGVPDENVFFVGYRDSGMAGTPENQHPAASVNAEDHEAVGRVVRVIREFRPSVLVTFDEHGGYGHPDHVKVHHVARRAAELATHRPRLLESTMNRTGMVRDRQARLDRGEEVDWDPEAPMDDGNPLGSTEDEITWAVDVSDYIDQRRAAVRAHASQADTEWMRTMPDEEFARLFGQEFYIEPGYDGPMRPGWPFVVNGRSPA